MLYRFQYPAEIKKWRHWQGDLPQLFTLVGLESGWGFTESVGVHSFFPTSQVEMRQCGWTKEQGLQNPCKLLQENLIFCTLVLGAFGGTFYHAGVGLPLAIDSGAPGQSCPA